MKAYLTFLFGYCLLICINRIDNIRKRALRLIYNHNQSSFKEHLEKENV